MYFPAEFEKRFAPLESMSLPPFVEQILVFFVVVCFFEMTVDSIMQMETFYESHHLLLRRNV